MSIAEVRTAAARFHQRNQRWAMFTAVLLVVIVGIEGWQILRQEDIVERAGDLLTVAAIIYSAYRFRDYYPREAMPATLGLTASVDFYRTRLARQHELASRPWAYLLVFVPGIALSVLPSTLERPLWQSTAMVASGVALFLVVAWVNARTARKIKAEIDRLG